jgi:hypothetical protein
LSALTNCGPLARPRWSATMTTVRRKTRPGDPAGGALLPKPVSCRIAKSRLDILGWRAGPGVDWHRSSLSSGSIDGAHDLGDCRYGTAPR